MADKDFLRSVEQDVHGVLNGSLTNNGSTGGNIRDMLEMPPFSTDELDTLKIVYASMPNRKLLNAFRDLRTKLVQRANGDNFVCLVSSLCRQGGGSYVTTNLAASFALDQAKASLIIDGDLYDPSVDRLLTGEAEAGLTDFLCDPSLDVKDIIYASGIPRLRVIPVGGNCEGGAEYFASSRMRNFMLDVKRRYSDRFIFVDAPPVVSSAETRILSELCDMVVLVVPYGKVGEAQIQAGIEEVGKDKLVGVVFNN